MEHTTRAKGSPRHRKQHLQRQGGRGKHGILGNRRKVAWTESNMSLGVKKEMMLGKQLGITRDEP